MVPVNTALNNQQNSWNYPEDFETSYNITDTEVTENGVVLSLYNVPVDSEYSYKARIVSAGTYLVPPATVSLMYSPEIYGRSSSDTVTIEQTMGTNSGTLTNKIIWPVKVIAITFVVAVVVALALYLNKKRKSKSLKKLPPVAPPIDSSTQLPPTNAI